MIYAAQILIIAAILCLNAFLDYPIDGPIAPTAVALAIALFLTIGLSSLSDDRLDLAAGVTVALTIVMTVGYFAWSMAFW